MFEEESPAPVAEAKGTREQPDESRLIVEEEESKAQVSETVETKEEPASNEADDLLFDVV